MIKNVKLVQPLNLGMKSIKIILKTMTHLTNNDSSIQICVKMLTQVWLILWHHNQMTHIIWLIIKMKKLVQPESGVCCEVKLKDSIYRYDVIILGNDVIMTRVFNLKNKKAAKRPSHRAATRPLLINVSERPRSGPRKRS